MISTPGPSAVSRSPSRRVIQEVSAHTDTDQLELPPLYDTVDPDALDELVGVLDDGTVQFQYADRLVTVHSDGTVHVTDEPGSDTE